MLPRNWDGGGCRKEVTPLLEALLRDLQDAHPHLPPSGSRKRRLPLTAPSLDVVGEGTRGNRFREEVAKH